MHFSVPDTQELNDGSGSTYIGFNIHINGVFHCTVRYKQLHNLHEQFRKEFGVERLPTFPPKKILPLTGSQLEERRALLEKYIQILGQDSKLVSSELLIGFLLSAQQETTCEKKQEMKLDIYTMTNHQISLRVLSTDRTHQVLTKACLQIKLPSEYISYFALFLIKKEDNTTGGSGGDTIILRKLQDFESPYISHKSIKDSNRIVLRKSYWVNDYDLELMTDKVSLNLLYSQTVSDIERGWILCTREIKSQLAHMQARLAKRDYIELARTLKYYGYMQFQPCICDYPKPQTKVLVAIGGQELSLRLLGSSVVKEGCFKVTRMRCWRITAISSTTGTTTTKNKQQQLLSASTTNNGSSSSSGNKGSSASTTAATTTPTTAAAELELSFEYLMSKDNLQWISITSSQSILMSVCLQSMVDELLLVKNGSKPTKANHSGKSHWSYMKRDGSSHLITLADPDVYHSQTNGSGGESLSKFHESFSIKRLQEKFSSVSFKTGKEFVENHAFEGIGDDDL